ncbi:complement decay-accelerating factor transmembrane isoform isoform X4 [Stegastes partitus]|uniref:Complement decay-accelerating factor transmembrane isoform isoform X4 n=1 Tax=Stegastes partitus TaxID=144197 RepID=A0A9Y4JK84_9TELE|nr:PREDICTED: complement decay-accelerating factor isoform X4 [Stegastes partitus]
MEALLDTCGRRGVKPLLLLYLLVVQAAADCPKPQGRENIVLTNEALLMNDFPESSEATLECANGYVRESGSGIITCIDKKWTEPDLTCKKKDCGPPKPQENMSFNTSAGTLFGAVIRVICDKGYRISGSSYKQCFAAGWSGRAKCNIVTCATPPEVTNGKSSWDTQDHPKYGEIVQYTCDEGYTLTGNDSIVCRETGKYDSQPPECNEGARDILAAGDTTTSVTSNTSSSLQGKHDEPEESGVGYKPVIISVIVVLLVVCIVVFFIHKFLLRRKGSYDTREDLKPELLQFQNL